MSHYPPRRSPTAWTPDRAAAGRNARVRPLPHPSLAYTPAARG